MSKHTPKIDAVILAAGMGTRMKSEVPKVLHPLLGRPMIDYILRALSGLVQDPPLVVIGSGAEQVRAVLGDRARYVVQDPQLGTAHAALCARDLLRGRSDAVIVANSDFPLITAATYRRLADTHLQTGSKLTLSIVVDMDSRGFGRIVRDPDGRIIRVVEEKVATEEELRITELNSNPYCFDAQWLWQALDRVQKSPVGEYYLTDLIEIAYEEGLTVGSIEIDAREEPIGINNRIHLAEATRALQRRINRYWMLEGVTMIDPDRVYIEDTVMIGRDTVLYPEVYLRGDTRIGNGCELGPSVMIENTIIGDRCRIKFAALEGARLENDVDMGPFAHLRKGAHLDEHVHMGNFGEVKNSHLGPGVKMGHFSYIGDAEIGADVNIGAGTITCNFDGETKQKTVIGEGAFIGSDTMLVAPVRIGKNAKTGAGAVVTHDVPDNTTFVGVPARPLKKTLKEPGSKEEKTDDSG